MRGCLTENELLALLTCDADDETTLEQAAHLETCLHCQAAADRLTEARELEPAFVHVAAAVRPGVLCD